LPDDINVTLDHSVALVLFDFLAPRRRRGGGRAACRGLAHKAELPALWATLAALESV